MMKYVFIGVVAIAILIHIYKNKICRSETVGTITERQDIGDGSFCYLAQCEVKGSIVSAEVRGLSEVRLDPGTRLLCQYKYEDHGLLLPVIFPKEMEGYARLLSIKEDGSWDAVTSGPERVSLIVNLSSRVLFGKSEGNWVPVRKLETTGEYVVYNQDGDTPPSDGTGFSSDA